MKEQEKDSAKIPSKEELMKAMQEQIEFKRLQVELQELNTKMAVCRASEMEAIAKMNHFSNPPEGKKDTGYVEHTITQEDLNNNPEMLEQGLQVGQVIGIPKAVYDQFVKDQEKEDKVKTMVGAESKPKMEVVLQD